ncbi:MAG: hypothetical protein PVI86_04625 [Phycisphaerae bacterium]|jgi:hypothetical protein
MGTDVVGTTVEEELLAILAPAFEGIEVDVGFSARWKRMCLTCRWAGFEGLLPEERFQRLMTVIPVEFRASRLAGLVWLELTPDESVEQYLKLPRSEDIAEREKAICGGLVQMRFFESLGELLGADRTDTCQGDFSATVALMSSLRRPTTDIHDVKLVFIRHGAYCDCQVLETVQPAVQKLVAGAA